MKAKRGETRNRQVVKTRVEHKGKTRCRPYVRAYSAPLFAGTQPASAWHKSVQVEADRQKLCEVFTSVRGCQAEVARSVRLDSFSRRSKLSASSVKTSRVAFNLPGDTCDSVLDTAASMAPTAMWLIRRPFGVSAIR